MATEQQFWNNSNCDSWTWIWSLAVLILISVFPRLLRFRFHFINSVTKLDTIVQSPVNEIQNVGLVTDLDLKNLIDELEGSNSDDVWENVVDKSADSVSYKAKCCKPKDGGALKYLSVTTFEECAVDVVLRFYMDNCYRMEWDKNVVQHEQLGLDESSGVEIGRTVKKFPLLTAREYVLAWRVWQGKDGSYYCFNKECEHHLAPRMKKYIRVGVYRSGWRIRKVPDRNACEIVMLHQEDSGLNVEMAKLAFTKRIWSYVCKMNDALQKYSAEKQCQLNSVPSAITFVQKVPHELEVKSDMNSTVHPENSEVNSFHRVGTCNSNKTRKLTRKPSSKVIANGLILVGGVICLSRGQSSLGAKVAMAYMLGKLSKRGAASKQLDNI